MTRLPTTLLKYSHAPSGMINGRKNIIECINRIDMIKCYNEIDSDGSMMRPLKKLIIKINVDNGIMFEWNI